MKQIIRSDKAPKAIGPYSQAIKTGNTVYFSGQLGLDPESLELVNGVEAQAQLMFKNIQAIAEAVGSDLTAVVKLTIFLTDMADFQKVNQVMEQFWQPPYPARSCIAVKQLPKNALVEAEAILVLSE
jgi:reactive intermediate/imine deaminase